MLICLLPCCVKAFEVLIAALHHAVIDIAQPVRLCQGEDETGDKENPVSYGLIEDGLQQQCLDDGYEHGGQRNDGLPLVFHLVLASNLLVQGQGGLVIDGHLQQHEIDRARSREEVCQHHQYGELARKDGYQREDERQK